MRRALLLPLLDDIMLFEPCWLVGWGLVIRQTIAKVRAGDERLFAMSEAVAVGWKTASKPNGWIALTAAQAAFAVANGRRDSIASDLRPAYRSNSFGYVDHGHDQRF